MKEITPKQLYNYYIIENKGSPEISKIYNCSVVTICRYLKKFGIKTRTQTEAGLNKVTKEFKQKISNKNKGKHFSPNTEFKKGCIPKNKGKRHSKETRNKISDKRKENWKDIKYRTKMLAILKAGLSNYLSKKEKLIKICLNPLCKKEFVAGFKTNKTSHTKKFCSKQCAYSYWHYNLEARNKISIGVKKSITTHHIDGIHKNDKNSNKVKLPIKIHGKLHTSAYRFLYTLGYKTIISYINWLEKEEKLDLTELKESMKKHFKLRREENNINGKDNNP